MRRSEENKLQPLGENKSSLRESLAWPPSPNEEKYPYDEWFDGSVWKLVQYEDFFVSPRSMQSAIYQSARKRNLKVKTHIPVTADSIYIQVIQNDE